MTAFAEVKLKNHHLLLLDSTRGVQHPPPFTLHFSSHENFWKTDEVTFPIMFPSSYL